MQLRHRVRTSASPGQVWRLLGDPTRWPEFDLFLHRVAGSHRQAVTGQHLMATWRGPGLRVPIDVLEARPDSRLRLRISALPGITQEVTYEVTPRLRGGAALTVSVVVEGLFARPAALPLWLSAGLSARVLAARAERLARAERVAPGAA